MFLTREQPREDRLFQVDWKCAVEGLATDDALLFFRTENEAARMRSHPHAKMDTVCDTIPVPRHPSQTVGNRLVANAASQFPILVVAHSVKLYTLPLPLEVHKQQIVVS